MKKLVLMMGAIVILGMLLKAQWSQPIETKVRPPSLEPTPITPATLTLKWRDRNFNYSVTDVDTTRLKLIINYDQQLSSSDLIEIGRCKAGVNGGFYQPDKKPLGWVVLNGEELYPERKSTLFNAYLNVYEDKSVDIKSEPGKSVRYAVQTGPLLVKNGLAQQLQLTADKESRRMVAAIGTDTKLRFITIYDENFVLDGPTLSDLPQIVEEVGKTINVRWMSATNLDGGAASAFYSPTLTLNEWSPIGSWWCIY